VTGYVVHQLVEVVVVFLMSQMMKCVVGLSQVKCVIHHRFGTTNVYWGETEELPMISQWIQKLDCEHLDLENLF
jgi:hypothetical protein